MTKTCPTKDQIRSFLDETLDAQGSSEISLHLETCRQCQSVCDALTESFSGTPRGDVARQSTASLGQLIDRLIQQPPTSTTSPESLTEIRFPGAADAQATLGRLAGYAILERVAEGTQGVLFRARDESLNRIVAIKVIHPQLAQTSSSMERFRREARLIAAVQSDHVVQVFQIGTEPLFPPFLVMEYVAGESLKERFDREKQIPVRRVAEIVRDVALGLHAAHASGLVHRDIKPSNVLIDQLTGRVRLTDFGLAVEQTDAARMTREGTLLGTPAYMSPEQVTNPNAIDGRSDIYSLGVMMYELLAGEVPFRGTVRMTVLQVVHDDPRPPRQLNDTIPADLQTICLKAMSKDRQSRFATGREFADELNRWLEGKPILSRPAGRIERLFRWCRRNPVVSSLSALVLTLLVTLTAVMTWSSIRLAESSRAANQNARAAQEQSIAALQTLGQLIFELQKQFDREEIDLNDLQKQSLQIALDGLRKVRSSTGEFATPDLPTAEALRRLGDLLGQLQDTSEALTCLRQSESILRSKLNREPGHLESQRLLVEVLWSIDEFDEEADASDLSLLQEAATLADDVAKKDSSVAVQQLVSIAQLKLGGRLADSEDSSKSLASLDKAIAGFNGILASGSKAAESKSADITEEIEAAQMSLLECMNLKYVALWLNDDPTAFTVLAEAQSRAKEFLSQNATPELRVYELELQDRVTAHWEDAEEDDKAVAAQAEFDRLATVLATYANEDEDRYFDASMSLSEVTDDRLFVEDFISAERMLRTQILLAEQRLKVARDDSFARTDLATAWSDLGSALDALNEGRAKVAECFQKSLAEYEQLSLAPWFDELDWSDYLETAVTAAELTQTRRKASTESAEFKAKAQSAIARCRELCPELPNDWYVDFEHRLQSLR